MFVAPFRFLHASDFHLEQPLQGLEEIPDHLRQALVDAPYRAAERVFDAAINEAVDFLILAGDLADATEAGPRSIAFLVEQFERLAEQRIAIYWATGRADSDDLWNRLDLPDGVHRFPPEALGRVLHERDGQPLVEILGSSEAMRRPIRARRFESADRDRFTIAVDYGLAEVDTLTATHVNYWALGGEHARRTLCTTPTVAHYPGTPQGRRPRDSGPRGCTLVHVDDAGQVHTRFAPTDALRWQRERLSITPTTTAGQLERMLHERAQTLLGGPTGPDLLTSWSVQGSGPLISELRRGKLSIQLLARLRAEYGPRHPGLWSVSLDAVDDGELPQEWRDQETFLGEFLRTVRHLESTPDEPLPLENYLAERHLAGSLASAILPADAQDRARLLREVARLGSDLLRPEEPRP